MDSWVTREVEASDMPDKRLEARLTKILTSLGKNSEESIPAACQGWSETKSAYRFLDNPSGDGGVDQPLTVFYVFQPAGTVNFMHHKHFGEK